MRDQSWTRDELLHRISDYALAAGAETGSSPAPLDEAHAGPIGRPTLPRFWPTPAGGARLAAWPSQVSDIGAPTLAARARARATLPLLAQGASGVTDWRRKRLATASL